MRIGFWASIVLLIASQAMAERKIALVIGNGTYSSDVVIENIADEVTEISASLTRLGFEVRFHQDLDAGNMRAAIARFSDALESSDVAMLYYAGHGIQLSGRNYLIPTDAVLTGEADVELSTIPVDVVLDQLERVAKTRIVFLDTCRDNPMQDALAERLGSQRAAEVLGKCLAPVNTNEGTFVGFANGAETFGSAPAQPTAKAPQMPGCKVCPATVLVPGGQTVMGTFDGTPAETPEVVQTISPFHMAVTEITIRDIKRFEEATGQSIRKGCFAWTDDGRLRNRQDASWAAPGYDVLDSAPAACLSWDDAQGYIKWLNDNDPTGGWRLPSEAEFEFAARAGSAVDYPWIGGLVTACEEVNGADASSRFRWRNKACDDGASDVASVGSYPANRFGLHDLIGNLWEWTEDCWNASHKGAAKDGRARATGSCESRVLRGGSWDDPIENLRAPYRVGIPKSRRQANVGFRPVRDLP